jgi:hypothetical protein
MTLSHGFLQRALCYSFSNQSPEKISIYLIKNACEELNEIDSILLDELCIAFGNHYVLSEKFRDEQKLNQNEAEVIEKITQELKRHSKGHLKAELIFRNIKLVY